MKNSTTYIIGIIVVLAIAAGVFLVWQNRDEMETMISDMTDSDTSSEEPVTYTDISVADAYELISTEGSEVVVLDVSNRYASGHLPGAVNYYVGDGSLDNAIPTLDPDDTYLVYCHVDSAAITGAEKLISAGFSDVYRLEGNYSAWLDGGYPIEVLVAAVGSYTGSGRTTQGFRDGQFSHSVVANLGMPAEGKFYEGWLVKDSGAEFFSTGRMELEGGTYVLRYTSSTDQRSFNEVVITEETEANGLDGVPEAHVLEGAF